MAVVRWFQDQKTDAFHIQCHAADKAQKTKRSLANKRMKEKDKVKKVQNTKKVQKVKKLQNYNVPYKVDTARGRDCLKC